MKIFFNIKSCINGKLQQVIEFVLGRPCLCYFFDEWVFGIGFYKEHESKSDYLVIIVPFGRIIVFEK